MISPPLLLISSPTMTGNGARRCNSSAPSIVLWSVTAMQSKPVFTHRRASVSNPMNESGEKREWT